MFYLFFLLLVSFTGYASQNQIRSEVVILGQEESNSNYLGFASYQKVMNYNFNFVNRLVEFKDKINLLSLLIVGSAIDRVEEKAGYPDSMIQRISIMLSTGQVILKEDINQSEQLLDAIQEVEQQLLPTFPEDYRKPVAKALKNYKDALMQESF